MRCCILLGLLVSSALALPENIITKAIKSSLGLQSKCDRVENEIFATDPSIACVFYSDDDCDMDNLNLAWQEPLKVRAGQRIDLEAGIIEAADDAIESVSIRPGCWAKLIEDNILLGQETHTVPGLPTKILHKNLSDDDEFDDVDKDADIVECGCDVTVSTGTSGISGTGGRPITDSRPERNRRPGEIDSRPSSIGRPGTSLSSETSRPDGVVSSKCRRIEREVFARDPSIACIFYSDDDCDMDNIALWQEPLKLRDGEGKDLEEGIVEAADDEIESVSLRPGCWAKLIEDNIILGKEEHLVPGLPNAILHQNLSDDDKFSDVDKDADLIKCGCGPVN